MPDIIYEDKDLIVVRKPVGQESQRGRTFAMDLESELRNYLANQYHKADPYLGVVHRLDRPVAGVMVYAKTRQTAAGLSAQFAQTIPHKTYEAVVLGQTTEEKQLLSDVLIDVKGQNRSRIASSGEAGKTASLYFSGLAEGQKSVYTVREDQSGRAILFRERVVGTIPPDYLLPVSRITVDLVTGRRHQIRVQMAEHGTPVLGDGLYGGSIEGFSMRGICLCAVSLSFTHPMTKKRMTFRFEDN